MESELYKGKRILVFTLIPYNFKVFDLQGYLIFEL